MSKVVMAKLARSLWGWLKEPDRRSVRSVVIRPPVIAAMLTLTLSGLAAGQTDDAVRDTVGRYRESLMAAAAAGRVSAAENERLVADALGDLKLAEMTAAQLAMLYRSRMLTWGERRDAAIARLAEFSGDRSVTGASAAVLRLELLGNHFGWVIDGERVSYHPESDLQAELLRTALEHPALRVALRQGDAAAVILLGAIGGMANAEVWSEFADPILALQDLYDDQAPVQFLYDGEDYLEVLEQVAPAQVAAARQRIVAAGKAVLDSGAGLGAEEREDLAALVAHLQGAAARGELVGHPAPPLDFIWSHPRKIASLDDLKGRVVVLDFWATSCGPCVASFPQVRQLRAYYDGYPVEIVGVTSLQGYHVGTAGRVSTRGDTDGETSLMRRYMEERDITWTVAFSRQNVYNPDYGIRGIPHVVILDPEGRVRHRGLHPADPIPDKTDEINAILAEYGLPTPPDAIATQENLLVTMSDGVRLATDVHLPGASGSFPAILVRTPYDKRGVRWVGRELAPHGYAVVAQDVRGKGRSEGTFRPFVDELRDGLDTLDWIAAQPWCDGTVGTWGSSYPGFCGLILAPERHPALKAIVQISGWSETPELICPGGAMHLMFGLTWSLTRQIHGSGSFTDYDWPDVFARTPVSGITESIGIDRSAWPWMIEDWIIDAAEQKASVAGRYGDINVPILHMTGWNDFISRFTLDVYERVETAGAGRVPQALVVGPWEHDGYWSSTHTGSGDEEFGAASAMGSNRLVDLSLDWFDRWLTGDDTVAAGRPVRLFTMGENAWNEYDQWPPAGVVYQRWYLDSADGATSLDGDGRLSSARPGSGTDTFRFDPADPVPTIGGANFHHFEETLGPRDQRPVERRHDVLVYTSAPLERDLVVIGPLEAVIYASSEGPNTDFTAKLVAVRPDGYARIVEDGIRRGADTGAVMRPGEIHRFTIDLGATAIRIPAGHRLRVEVSSSNFPKFTRNPNTGEVPELASEFRAVTQTVHHSLDYPSHIVLPVFRPD